MSGFPANFVTELQPRHKCTICQLAMKSPVQTGCGHLFCKICLEPELQRPHPKCPVDHEKISREETFPDNACRREILLLMVYCDNHAAGCPWTGELKKLEVHLEVCDYRRVQCTQCGRRVLYINYKAHVSSECPMRPAVCEHCGDSIPIDQLETHIKKVCPSSVHKCPNQCDPSRQFKVAELKKHLEVKGGDCPLHEIPCPFFKLGCSFKSLRKSMDDHLDKFKVYHAQLTADVLAIDSDTIKQLAKDQERMERRLVRVETKTSAIESNQDYIEEKYGLQESKREKKVDRLESTILTIEQQVLKLQLGLEDLQRQFKPSPSLFSSPSSYHTPFSSGATAAYGSTISQRVDHLYSKVSEFDHTLNRCLNHSLECDVRIQLLERATYDGTFLWKIDNYAQRRREAIDGSTLSLYSSPFYTSKQGYKMCARVYLNGDGSGKGTHLSFFFCVMRGINDALLPWPFQQKVTLLLINQNGRKNVVDQFRPDTQSSSFQRPLHREMNVASGCPTFCPLSELHNGFVKDDCIFLGVIVDTVGIPKPVSL